MLCGNYILSNRSEWTFYFLSSVQFNFTISEDNKKLTESEIDLIKGRSAAVDNFGNFFAQNLFVASGGVLLISSTMKSLGYKVDPVGIVLNTIPIAIITFILVFAYNLYFDRQMKKWEGK